MKKSHTSGSRMSASALSKNARAFFSAVHAIPSAWRTVIVARASSYAGASTSKIISRVTLRGWSRNSVRRRLVRMFSCPSSVCTIRSKKRVTSSL